MALVVKDRVQETATTTGTGTFTLAGAVSGFQSFSVIGDGNTTYYAIVGGTEWEVGIGTYTALGTVLSRDTILESSNGGTAVNFSAGTKNVFVTYPAEKGLYLDASGNAIALGTPASATLTNATGLPISTGVSGLGANVATFLATPSSANLAAAVTDETGSGALVFATSPTLATPVLGTPSSGTLTSCTGLPLTTGVTGTLPVANGGTGTATAFTTGSVVFAGASGVYSQDNTNFFWDDTNNRLGIGTASPTAKLQVNGSMTMATANWFSYGTDNTFYSDSSYGLVIKAPATSNFIAFRSSNDTERMRIDSSGNVGIGTASPDALLTVNTIASFGDGAVGTPSIAHKGDLNTGIFFSAADTIDFTEGGTACGQFDSSGNFKFNSGYGSVATAYGCRAWVNFNGTGTVAIRASGNVTSITDNGTGLYTINFTNAMPDANYCMASSGSNATSTSPRLVNGYTYNTGSTAILTQTDAGVASDAVIVNVAFFR